MVGARKGEHQKILEDAKRMGYVRVRVDGEIRTLDEEITLDRKRKHTIEIVVDRLVGIRGEPPQVRRVRGGRPGNLRRDAHRPGPGEGRRAGSPLLPEERLPDVRDQRPGAAAAAVLLQQPLRRLPGVLGPRGDAGVRPGASWFPTRASPSTRAASRRTTPRPTGTGASSSPWPGTSSSPWTRRWRSFPRGCCDAILNGTKEKIGFRYESRDGRGKWEFQSGFRGVLNDLKRRYLESSSEQVKEWMEGFMSQKECAACGGRRLKPEVLAVTVGDRNIHEVTQLSGP